MMGFLHSLLSFAVVIGVLVTVHEFGHYWVARRLGVKVLRFSIGFGKPLWTWRAGRDRTEYVLAAVPLGGYVKMLDENEGDVAPAELSRAFNRQPLWRRCAIVCAGPFFNFLFAVFAYWVMFVAGVSGLRPLIASVPPGGLAAHAGLHAGDEVVSVGGTPVKTWESVIHAVVERALERGDISMEVRGAGGEERRVVLPMAAVSVDRLAQGRFFDVLGMQPQRPRIPPVIDEVEGGSPAERGGLRRGDRVVESGGERITSWQQWVKQVRAHADKPLKVVVQRGDKRVRLVIVPERAAGENGTVGHIGAGVREPAGLFKRYYVMERHGPVDAMARAFAKTGEVTAMTLRVLWKMLTLQISLDNLSGPISIAKYAGASASIGLSRFFEFMGLVSVSLGILNLLPIPVLDGGHLMYYLIEAVRGRPVSEQAQYVGQRIGFAVLFGLMGLAFYNDIVRLFG